MSREILQHCSTLNLMKLAEHIAANDGHKDLGLTILMVDVMMVLCDRLPLSAQAAFKEDLRKLNAMAKLDFETEGPMQ